MPNGLSGRDIVIAILLAIVIGAAGAIVGQALGMIWLGYVGSGVAVAYLVIKYMKAEEPGE